MGPTSQTSPGAVVGSLLIPPETVPVPGGRLETGAAGEGSQFVEIAPFRLGRTPVTNRDYAPFLASGRAVAPPWWTNPDFSAPLQPVVGVTWGEAMAYCEWLAEARAGSWRLPTEAEWEFAACGGLVAPETSWGDSIPIGEIPGGPLSGPWETGRGSPNGYGVLDAGTIVHEWCLNWHEPERPAMATSHPPQRRRASRGGSWRHEIRWSRPAARSSLPPEFRYSDYGFRVLREMDR